MNMWFCDEMGQSLSDVEDVFIYFSNLLQA